MKKILSLALALVLSLAVSSMPAATENVDYFQYEGETYMQQKDGNPQPFTAG